MATVPRKTNSNGSTITLPTLRGDALRAVRHRGSHIQLLAAAGVGKTEVTRQRIVELLAEGVEPESIVALAFNVAAGEELKIRVAQGVEAHPKLGRKALDRMGRCFIGTLHSYCFQILQQYVPKYETYDVLDDQRLAAFLARVANRIGLKELGGQLYKSIDLFQSNLEVVEADLIPTAALREPFRSIYEGFMEQLEQFRLITYGQQVAAAVRELERPEVFAAVHAPLRHLLVDEYQDVNAAQERLIARLAADPVELFVVGDDDQSIYQWRGTDVRNIIEFPQRYAGVVTFRLTKNRRSRPAIIRNANTFAQTIQDRLGKEMKPHRAAAGPAVVGWVAPTEADEAEKIAQTILQLVKHGYRYRDIAVLFRGWVSFPALAAALARHDIPVMPGGRTGLFKQAEADLFGRTLAFLADTGWSQERFGPRPDVSLPDLVTCHTGVFGLGTAEANDVRTYLQQWKARVPSDHRPVDLIKDYYGLLRLCGVSAWDLRQNAVLSARAGTLGRCSLILKDYESVRRRARPDPDDPGSQRGGVDRGKWYYQGLATFVQNWANGTYEGFDGDDKFLTDAVELTTIHKAKGLEWPAVFVASLSSGRFPSSKTGTPGTWFISPSSFNARRYEGTLNDERRLFYVAITRARDWLSLSTHERVTKQRVGRCVFFDRLIPNPAEWWNDLPLPHSPEPKDRGDEPIVITYSDLAAFAGCGYAYRLRNCLGFEAPISQELGYGRGVHNVLRYAADIARESGAAPTTHQIDRFLDHNFYLPAATKPAHALMKKAAREIIHDFVDENGQDLTKVWATEHPFELHLDEATITGRADVVLREHNDGTVSYEIDDYKVSEDTDFTPHDRQLRVYASAGRREGLNVTQANVYDLKSRKKRAVNVSPTKLKQAEKEITTLLQRLNLREFDAAPGAHCEKCDVERLCPFRA
jgi:DNA helicase-2/ATP-dependent DNA helicase PcrA